MEPQPGELVMQAGYSLLYAVSAASVKQHGNQLLRPRPFLLAPLAPSCRKTWAYCVDVDAAALKEAGLRRLQERLGSLERQQQQQEQAPLPALGAQQGQGCGGGSGSGAAGEPVVVVGCGPAGLWAALQMAEAGIKVVLLERGQPVEVRGKDIGALFVRRRVNPESNLCYGEGGAGTWSDGKLTTRIGRNSDPVRAVLNTLYRFGAPEVRASWRGDQQGHRGGARHAAVCPVVQAACG